MAIRRLASSTRGALLLLDAIDRGTMAEPLRREILAVSAPVPRSRSETSSSDSSPRPSESSGWRRGRPILDPDPARRCTRGRLIFDTNPGAQCKTCHKAGDVGQSVGPDLTKIGSKYDRAALLDQILEPSKTIDPQYASYLVETRDGLVLTGLVVERNGREFMLKDAQAKTVSVPTGKVERLAPQSRSLMPELLLRDLTAQQVADLLEYLATLR